MPGRTTRPLTRPNQTSLPSTRAELALHALPAVDEHHGARALVDPIRRRHAIAAAVGVRREHTREHANERDRAAPSCRRESGSGGRSSGRSARAARAAGRRPSGTTRSRLSRPSHVYETRPAGSRRFRTIGSNRPAVPIQDVERHGLLRREDERDDRDVARALADRREDAIDARAGDRAPLELQPLGDRERCSGRPSRARTIRSCGHRATARNLDRLEPAHEDEWLRVLAAAARAVELRCGADRALAARMRVVAALRLVVGERRHLPLDRRR